MSRLGADVGGTFTDLARVDPTTGLVTINKVLTTPADPGDAVLAGCEEMLARHGQGFANVTHMAHATTLVANTLIQRVGARVALICNEGFVDVLDTGVEMRFDLFDLNFRRPEPLVPRYLRFGISERTGADGRRLQPVDAAELRGIVDRLLSERVEAVAVALFHSYRNQAAEREVRTLLNQALPAVPVTLSCEVAPEIREWPRTSTAVANAYVQPLVQRYVSRLAARLRERGLPSPLFMMLSEGGIGSVETVKAAPIRLVESGPAAGALAAAAVARELGLPQALAFDLGGTTAKLCMIGDGQPMRSYQTEVARLDRFKRGSGLPLKIPAVELIEIGTGGGSIAHFDAANLLRVGPRSAGAEPGPACYGRGGTEPTVTDADLVAGYLDDRAFLGGRMSLDRSASERALQLHIGNRLGIGTLDAAAAVLEVVNESMALAARVHVVEHGDDLRRYALIAFGGAGPVHAWRIASILKLETVIVPPAAGVMSAVGLLAAPAAIELARSHVGKLDGLNVATIDGLLDEMTNEARRTLTAAGVAPAQVRLHRLAECRYVGQAYEVQVVLPSGRLDAGELMRRFETRYCELYGRTMPGGSIEALTWRVQAEGPAPIERLQVDRSAAVGGADKGKRRAHFPGHGVQDCRVLNRYALAAGSFYDGPLLVEENETTTVVGPGARLEIDQGLNLVIRLNQGRNT
jgi:N-methylhydantoinase A